MLLLAQSIIKANPELQLERTRSSTLTIWESKSHLVSRSELFSTPSNPLTVLWQLQHRRPNGSCTGREVWPSRKHWVQVVGSIGSSEQSWERTAVLCEGKGGYHIRASKPDMKPILRRGFRISLLLISPSWMPLTPISHCFVNPAIFYARALQLL